MPLWKQTQFTMGLQRRWWFFYFAQGQGRKVSSILKDELKSHTLCHQSTALHSQLLPTWRQQVVGLYAMAHMLIYMLNRHLKEQRHETKKMPRRMKSGKMTFEGLAFLSYEMLFAWALLEVTLYRSNYDYFLLWIILYNCMILKEFPCIILWHRLLWNWDLYMRYMETKTQRHCMFKVPHSLDSDLESFALFFQNEKTLKQNKTPTN